MSKPRSNEFLIVDGYNIVGAWGSLRELANQDFDAARDQLIDRLADYGGHANLNVIAVFDAHLGQGRGVSYEQGRVDVRFTKAKETADEYIERLVGELRDQFPQATIRVATSDGLQQTIIFAKGAYRMPASELERLTNRSSQASRQKIKEMPRRSALADRLNADVLDKLDRFRKGEDGK